MEIDCFVVVPGKVEQLSELIDSIGISNGCGINVTIQSSIQKSEMTTKLIDHPPVAMHFIQLMRNSMLVFGLRLVESFPFHCECIAEFLAKEISFKESTVCFVCIDRGRRLFCVYQEGLKVLDLGMYHSVFFENREWIPDSLIDVFSGE